MKSPFHKPFGSRSPFGPQSGVTADWHVDGAISASGDGTSRSSAFKTIAEALSNASLAAGERIAVYSGTYEEALTLTKSGTSGNAISLFGVGNVIIEGGNLLTGWSACTNQADALGSPQWANMYKAFVPSSVSMIPLCFNLRQAGETMYLPVLGATSGGFTTNDHLQNPKDETRFATGSGSTATTLTDATGLPAAYPLAADLDNAYVLLHHSGNAVIWRKISSYNAGTGVITFSSVTTELAGNTLSNKYAILNAGLDVSRAGMWAFKEAAEGDGTQKVVCYPISSSDMTNIRVSARKYGIDVADESYWTIENLEARGQSGDGTRDGLGFGTYTNNAAAKVGLTFNNLRVKNTCTWSGGAPAISIVGTSTTTDIDFNNCTTYRTMNGAGIYQNGTRVTIRNCTVSWPGWTGIRQHGCTDFLCYDNEVLNVFGSHANGMSFYLDCFWGIVAYNKVRSEKGIGSTFQQFSNILVFCNDIQAPLLDLSHRAIENNGTMAHTTETGGVFTVLNNSCGPSPGQTLAESSFAITIGKSGEITHNAVNNISHGGVDYDAASSHGTNAIEGDVSYNVLTGKDSAQATTDAFFTANQNSYRTTVADVVSDYSSSEYLPVSEGPLDGTGKDITTLLAPFVSRFPSFDFNRDITGAAVDWTTNPFIGAYKPTVTLAFDRNADAFTFSDLTDVGLAEADVDASPVQISGIVGQTWAEISGGTAANKELQVLASDGVTVIDAWRSGPALIKNGQYLAVRGDASASPTTATTVTAAVGTTEDTFSITTTASVPYQDILDLATTDGWHAVYDVSNPGERSVSGGLITSLGDGLGNLPDVAAASNKPSHSTNEFGSLDAIEMTSAQIGLDTSSAFTSLTQPYFVMTVIRDDASTTAKRNIMTASSTVDFSTRSTGSNPLMATAGTIGQSTHNRDANPHIVEVLYNGGSSQIFVDGVSVFSGALGANDLASPLRLGQAASTLNRWVGAIGPFLIYAGDPGTTKRDSMRDLLSSLTGISVA